ncbi:GAF domain-containing protein [Mycoplasmopsis columbina]|uniref:GAF domain-containing protein n=1 Tax=Mycoplasmopsis columbina TaxID=114881 RepID=UPI0004A6C64F|nr:GAF domain-containing protein [Mycoplasmopsis columbina]VEU76911.1 Free methionine-R-sulfoxide reductase [Mycoplasmopsis columbina]
MQIYKNLIENDTKIYTTLANTSAFIFQHFENLNWAGFYINEDEKLYLHAFQGKIACTEILFNRGVCGYAARTKEPVVVDNVHTFPDHIACDENSKSEMVIPLIVKGKLFGVLDIDAPIEKRFDKKTQKQLLIIAKILEEKLTNLL